MTHPSEGARKEEDRSVDGVSAVDAMNEQLEALLSGGDPRGMLELSERATAMARRLDYIKGEAYSRLFMGYAFWFLAEHRKGLEQASVARALFEKLDDQAGRNKALLCLHTVQQGMGTYDEALSNVLECLKFFRNEGLRFWEGLSLLSLSNFYEQLGSFKKAQELYEQTKVMGREVGKDWMVARALVGQGTIHRRLGAHDEALECYLDSLPLFRSSANPMGEARALNDLGLIYQQKGEHDQALDYHRRSLAIREQIGQRQAQCTSLINMGWLLIDRKQSSEALDVLGRALATAIEIQSKPRIYQAHEALSAAYELQGDFVAALKHHREFQKIKEDVFNRDANARISSLQTDFEVERAEKEAEIARLRNVELKETNERLERLLHELRAAQTQLLHSEKMAALGRLVAGLSHELNSPLGAIAAANDVRVRCLGTLDTVLKERESFEKVVLDERFQKAWRILNDDTQVIAAASGRLKKIVESLKTFARLDQAQFQMADLRAGLESVLELLPQNLTERITVIREFQEVPEIPCYPGEMNQVFMSLIQNAVDAIENRGAIRFQIAAEGRWLRIRIIDTGKGIPAARLKRLFEFDFTQEGSRVRMSTGLATAHAVVAKHQGRIGVESEVGKGTTFTIELPIEWVPEEQGSSGGQSESGDTRSRT
ncbi:MAG TPA: tetratricopeptide repeat-containing sensor histidine kinase [Vicinamibacteria bacterium]|nr:tetratricopeptide repeat-containing sensor histidine kinase [Vicinamibacteria bacterium]